MTDPSRMPPLIQALGKLMQAITRFADAQQALADADAELADAIRHHAEMSRQGTRRRALDALRPRHRQAKIILAAILGASAWFLMRRSI